MATVTATPAKRDQPAAQAAGRSPAGPPASTGSAGRLAWCGW